MSFKGGFQTRCLYDSEVDDDGTRRFSCHRVSLPGRFLCHKHAGQTATRDRRGTGAFAARFDGGKCAGCGDEIEIGESIVGRPEGWVHELCMEDVE